MKQINMRTSKRKHPVAICHNKTHIGYLTVAMIREHKCLHQKHITEEGKIEYRVCPFLEKTSEDYWHNIEHNKTLGKLNKKYKYTSISLETIKNYCKKHNWNIEQTISALDELLKN